MGGPTLSPAPVLAKYGVDRLVGGEARRDDRTHPDFPSRWWQPATQWIDVVTWFRRETLAGLQHGAESAAIRAVRAAVVTCLSDNRITDVYCDIRTEDLRVVFADTDLQLDLSSGGVRALVALVVDLATRACAANPQLGVDGPSESPGLVLIDEVELHLHPRWQRLLVPALRRTFPRMQLVATTHSPQVVGSVDSRCVRLLTADGAGAVGHTLGRDTNTVLEDVFGDPGRERAAVEALGELFEAIDRRDSTVSEKLAAAERALGPDDPDVARARFMVEMGL